MKQLTCEMCGGTDLLKQDGVFVCQSCGMKYSVEDAKRMMIEGTVDVKGTVKIDTSSASEQYLINARRAKQKGDWEEAEKYYNMVEKIDSANIEAVFYSAYAKYRVTILEDYSKKWEADHNVLNNCISVLDDYFKIEDEANQRKVIIDAFHDIMLLSGTGGNVICGKFSEGTPGRTVVSNWSIKLYPTMEETADNLIAKYKENNLDYSYLEKLKEELAAKKPNVKLAGCYVATAVYGSYDCPQVWTLRRYRDNTLAKTWYGRAFIHTYYAISPTLVKWFGHTEWFKNMWKGKLDRMVANLNADGVDNTPYQDRNW